jgi:D-alanyl-lipoteichoic acid acyltransferase DltB (MBOAT superfamily)
MLFNSYAFIFGFLPVTFGLFFLLGRWKRELAMASLAFMSVVFYAWWSVDYVALLLASVLFNYAIARAIEVARGRRKERRKQILLATGITGDLVILGYFKYANFFINTVNSLTGIDWSISHIVLPLGISFFTFTQIAFLVDAARGEARVKEFMPYLLFVTYFPHLLAGPIIHHKQVMPQFRLASTYRPSAENIAAGLTIFTIGLAKKVLIADPISPVAQWFFSSVTPLPLTAAWVGALAYTMQLYFDFSGYSDMAIGLSRIFGVELPLNFNSPYKATNIIEFWRRWHMTLSAFLRDYLYIPLGGNRKGSASRYRNLYITMLLGGLWHGAGWTYVIWGALHGLYLAANHLWRAIVTERPTSRWYRLGCGLLTFAAVVVAWVFFRSPDIETALRIQAGLIGANGLGLDLPAIKATLSHLPEFGHSNAFMIPVALAIAWLMPNTQEIVPPAGGQARRRDLLLARMNGAASGAGHWHYIAQRTFNLLRWNTTVVSGIGVGLLFFFCLTRLTHVSEFIYYQF